MPQLAEIPETLPESFPNRIRFTRDDCRFLVDSGLLTGRYELIDGEIISKMGQKPPHRVAIARIVAYLMRSFDPMRVQVQGPMDVATDENIHNEPEPDVAVLARSADETMSGNPAPEDVPLAIEVSDTTLRFDSTTKMKRYARAGIADYWVIDIKGRKIVVHRDPADDEYRSVVSYLETETVAPLILPSATALVADLLPPLQATEAETETPS